MEFTFAPRKSISEIYSLENMTNQHELSVEDFKLDMVKQQKINQDIIDEPIH